MELFLILIIFIQGILFIYFNNKIKKLEEKINNKEDLILVSEDFPKIQQASSFSQNLWNRLYGDK